MYYHIITEEKEKKEKGIEARLYELMHEIAIMEHTTLDKKEMAENDIWKHQDLGLEHQTSAGVRGSVRKKKKSEEQVSPAFSFLAQGAT